MSETEEAVVEETQESSGIQRTTFEVIFTNNSTLAVKGTRIVRPSDRDGILILDDITAADQGLDTEDGDGYVVVAVPNAVLMCVYDKEKEQADNEEMDEMEEEMAFDDEFPI